MPNVTAQYRYQVPHFFESSQGPLPGATLWEQVPGPLADLCDPAGFTRYHNDFIEIGVSANAIPGWTTTVATSGTVTQDAALANGALSISAGAATAGQGINLQLLGLPFKLAANKLVAFEARVQFTALTGPKIQFAVGLAEQITALIAAGALADKNFIGFSGVTTTGVIGSVAQRGTATNSTGTGFTIVNNGWYRLGFIALPGQVAYYVNGAQVASLAVAANIPTVGLAPILVVQANATDTPVVKFDYLRVFGYRQ